MLAEAFLVLLGLVLALVVVAVVGHGLWLLAAEVVRVLLGRGEGPPATCLRCGRAFPATRRYCPACGMETQGPEEAELRRLDTTERQLAAFLACGALEKPAWEHLQNCILERRRALLGDETPVPRTPRFVGQVANLPRQGGSAASPTGAQPPLPHPPPLRGEGWVGGLEQLLARCGDVRNLTLGNRQRALDWYAQMPEQERWALSATTQLALARLLRMQGLVTDALRCYRRLLTSHPNHPLAGRAALEAGRLAAQEGRADEARWFLPRSLGKSLAADEVREATELLQRLQSAGESEVFDALPAQAEPPAPAPVPPPSPPPAAGEGTGGGGQQGGEAAVQPSVADVLSAEPAAAETGVTGPPRVVAAAEAPPENAVRPPRERVPDRGARRLPRPPRKTLAEVLAAFMEERNILWGELVGGLLIVGCSIALVISLWTTLKEQLPYFPFMVFAGITAALFGAGLYTLHRWKLQSTSRGLLVIATLLVPLNFLVLAGLSIQPQADYAAQGVVEIGIEAIALAVFAGLVVLAARVLVPPGRWLLTIAVLGPAAGQILAARSEGEAGPGSWLYLALAAGPTLCHAGATAALLGALRGWRQGPRPPLQGPQARALFAFLGLATFAMAVTQGFLVYLGGDTRLALERLAALIAVSGVALLVSGLVVHRRLAEPQPIREPASPATEAEPTERTLPASVAAPATLGPAAVRTIGTAVALGGMFIMLLAVALAWPQPVAVLLVCVLNAVVLTAVAFRYALPVAHAPALGCLVLGFLMACHLFSGLLPEQEGELATALFSPSGGAALAAVVLLLALIAELLDRAGLRVHALSYAVGTAVVAALSLALVTFREPLEPRLCALVYGIYGAVSLAVNLRWRRPVLGYAGLGLLLGMTLWALQWGWAEQLPLWALVLAVEALVLSGLALVLDRAALQAEPASWLRRFAAAPPGPAWSSVPAAVWRDMAAVVGVLGMALALASPGFPDGALHTFTAAALAAAALLLAWTYRAAPLTWIGSCLFLAGLAHALVWDFTESGLPRPWLAALLAHGTVALAASLAVRAIRSPALQRIYAQPLGHAALLSSLLALPLACWIDRWEMMPLAAYTGWLAALWLVMAWIDRRPVLFTAFEAALSVAILFAVAAWLEGRPWLLEYGLAGFADPRSLQAYGIALAGLGLVGVIARRALRSRLEVEELLGAHWPTTYRLALGALLVLGHLGLAIWGVVPAVVQELTPASAKASVWPVQYVRAHGQGAWAMLPGMGIHPHQPLAAQYVHAYGPGAWVLLGALAVVLAAALWEPQAPRWRSAPVMGLLIVALTVPLLAAGLFAGELATASALRWGLAVCFLALSACLWGRGGLGRLGARLAVPGVEEPNLPVLTRALLIAGAVVPVLVLTAVVALVGFAGQRTTGPAAESVFARIGWVASNIVPLALLSAGLIGHAVRERSPGYTFAAGLLANATVVGGYALMVVTGGGQLDIPCQVFLLQLATGGAAAWGIAWLASRRWLVTETAKDLPTAAELLTIQLGMAAAGNVWLLGVALWWLLVALPGDFVGETRAWVVASGSGCGWLALGLTGTAVAVRFRQQHALLPAHLVGALGLAAVGLLGCSVEAISTGGGYQTVMIGCAASALAWAFAAWREQAKNMEVAAEESEEGWLTDALASILPFRVPEWGDAAAVWVRVGAVAAVLLAVKAALMVEDHLGAARALALAGTAAAVTAVRRRREDWAFAAGLGANAACALVVWHWHQQVPLTAWVIPLVQANAITTAGTALLWLGARRRLYEGPRRQVTAGPLLLVQVILGLAGAVVLLLPPLLWLLLSPAAPLPPELAQVGSPWGWLVLLLLAAAAFWYAGAVRPQAQPHLAAALGLAVAVLAACSANRWDQNEWLSYHVLMSGWTLTAAAILGAGLWPVVRALADHRRAEPASGTSGETGLPPWFSVAAAWVRTFLDMHARAAWVLGWVGGVGVLVLTLAVRGTWEDPGRPYWPAGAVLAVSLLIGVAAIGLRLPRLAYASGLLLNVAGAMAWVAWGSPTPVAFGYTQVVCFALASVLWSCLELALPALHPALTLRGRDMPFGHFALVLGLGLLTLLVGLGLASDLAGAGLHTAGPLAWAALAGIILAGALLLWDVAARGAAGALYAAGLLALDLAVNAGDLGRIDLVRSAALPVAVYLLAASTVAWTGARWPGLLALLRLPPRDWRAEGAWFLPIQSVLGGALVLFSVWLALAPETFAERLGGPLMVAVLIPAGVLLAGLFPPHPTLSPQGRGWPAGLRHAVLALAPLVLAEGAWAVLGRGAVSPELHRGVVLLLALAVMTWIHGVGLPRLLNGYPDWASAARRVGPVLGAVAAVVLLGVLAQEGLLYQIALKRTPMETWAILVVAAGLVVLIAAVIMFAVVPGRDPLGLSERGRMLYVYAAEALLALLFLHMRLTVPELFGRFSRYWPFIIMGVAFLGVGLSELFHRRRLPVLAEPLQWTGVFLPLLPLFAFWVKPPAALSDFAHRVLPGMKPFLDYLDRMPVHFDNYALLWFLLGAIYTTVALTRRSFRFALLAALAANCGLWALLVHYDLAFLAHPQLWLIPVAVIGLVAEHLNRDRLSHAQAGTLRYLSLCILYLSSTADMFIAGLDSLILPLVLAVLSVLGVLAGILLRVRAFLFLGVTFLSLVIFAMIWHAAVDRNQTIVWWFSGIVLGAAILTLFAVFEKRRNDILRMLEELQKWR